MTDREPYWVLQFLRENHISSVKQATAFLPSYGVMKALRRRAEDARANRSKSQRIEGAAIIAGSGVDLSSRGIVCPSPECMRSQVDLLFNRVWHYFDVVVVNDALTPLLTEDWEGSQKELLRQVLNQLTPLLYLDEVGGADYVEFWPKSLVLDGAERSAAKHGLGYIVENKERLIALALNESKFSVTEKDGKKVVIMDTKDVQMYDDIYQGSIDKTKARLIAEFLDYKLGELTGDVASALELQLPIGIVQEFVAQMLRSGRPGNIADVAFQLELPVLEGISTADLIRIRQENTEYFANFRNALDRAVRERLRVAKLVDSAEIAQEINRDIIQPELEKIRVGLAASEKSLPKKTSVGLFLGALTTTCGVLLGVPPALAGSAGIAATIGITGQAVSKHVDELRDNSLNDMYFLWKAVGHAH